MSGKVRRFAGFIYSQQTGLQRDGVQIHLGPQARQLLELLLDSNGSVVSKAEIAGRLWPGRPPSDDSIDRCAYLLRKPLREAGYGDLIATAYGCGLSLRADIEEVDLDREAQRLPQQPVNARILDLWQTAYELAGARTREGYERAQAAIAMATKLDPNSPAVWSLAADIAAWRAVRGYLTPHDATAMIEDSAGRAIELAPFFAGAMASLGWTRAAMSGRREEGFAMLDRAVSYEPHNVKARIYRSWARAEDGRLAEAIEDTETGLRDSPLNQTLLALRAWMELCQGDVAGSLEHARRGLELRPDGGGLRAVHAIAESLLGHHDDAAAWLTIAELRSDPLLLAVLAYVQAVAERREAAEAALEAATAAHHVHPPCLFVAAAELALGRSAEAVQWLERGRSSGCPWFSFAPLDPRLATLQGEIHRMRRHDAGLAGGG